MKEESEVKTEKKSRIRKKKVKKKKREERLAGLILLLITFFIGFVLWVSGEVKSQNHLEQMELDSGNQENQTIILK